MNDALLLPNEIASRLLSRLEYIRLEPSVILNLGLSLDYSTPLLQQRYPNAHVLERGIETTLHDLQSIATASVDFIFSNFFLPWMHALPQWFTQMRRLLKANGMILLSSAGPDTLKELRQCFKMVDAHAHTTKFVDMHDLGDIMLQTHFQDPVMDMEYISLHYPDVMTLIQDIRSIPIQRQYDQQRLGLMTSREWKTMTKTYEALRLTDGLPMTCEVIYGHAWIAEGPMTVAANANGEAIIPIH